MPTPSSSTTAHPARTLIIVALFLASFFVVKPLWRLFDLTGPERLWLLLIPAAATIAFVWSMRAMAMQSGNMTPAVSRYMGRLLVCILAYMALLVVANLLRDQWTLTGPLLWAVAILPAIPMLACIWVIGRYLVKEKDEYLRMRAAQASLFGTGLLLATAMVWGFLEQAGAVPHVPASYGFIVWCVGLGLGQAMQSLRA